MRAWPDDLLRCADLGCLLWHNADHTMMRATYCFIFHPIIWFAAYCANTAVWKCCIAVARCWLYSVLPAWFLILYIHVNVQTQCCRQHVTITTCHRDFIFRVTRACSQQRLFTTVLAWTSLLLDIWWGWIVVRVSRVESLAVYQICGIGILCNCYVTL